MNCGRSCGHDHSSKAPQSPSVVDLEVVRTLLTQALINMERRTVKVNEKELNPEEATTKNWELVQWLTDTFCGRNSHFEVGPEDWNPDGLAQFIQLTIPKILEGKIDPSPDDIVFEATTVFVRGSQNAVVSLLRSGGSLEDSDRLPPPLERFIESWAMLFVGAPDTFE